MPRMVVPGETVMLTRRCKERKHRLRPRRETNELVLYAYAYAACVTGVLIHAITAMSTHPHVFLTDPRGLAPMFAQLAHRTIALGLAKLQGIQGPVFDRESRTNFVRCVSASAMVQEMAYVIANPTTSFACKRPEKWRGVWANPLGMGARRMVVRRPEGLGDRYPETIELELTLPAALVEQYGEAGARQAIEARVEELCVEARATAAEKGRPIPRPEAAEALDPRESPRTPPPKSFTTPTIAAGGERDVWVAAQRARRAFYEAYRAAWQLWKDCCDGVRQVMFPCGTYGMRVFHACATAPP